MDKISTSEEVQAELRAILAMTEEPTPSRNKLATALRVLADRIRSATVFEAKRFEAVQNGIHGILDSISDELGQHKGGKDKMPANREVANLESARDDLQKALGLISKAQNRF